MVSRSHREGRRQGQTEGLGRDAERVQDGPQPSGSAGGTKHLLPIRGIGGRQEHPEVGQPLQAGEPVPKTVEREIKRRVLGTERVNRACPHRDRHPCGPQFVEWPIRPTVVRKQPGVQLDLDATAQILEWHPRRRCVKCARPRRIGCKTEPGEHVPGAGHGIGSDQDVQIVGRPDSQVAVQPR